MQEKYNKSDTIIITLLIILIIILFSFLCFISYLTIKKTYFSDNNNTIEIFKYKKSEEIPVDTSLKEEEVKSIYAKVFSNETVNIQSTGTGKNINYYFNCYTDSQVSIASILTYDQKCEIALNKIDSSKFEETLNDYGSGNRTIAIIDLQESYDNTFGYNTYFQNNFNNNYGSCVIEDLKINCTVNSVWSSESNIQLITIYDSYEQVDKTLYIYQYIAYYNKNSTYFTSDQRGYYTYRDLGSYTFTENNNDILNLNYKAFFKKYKHTFSLDDDNNYVWLTTEPVNETYDTVS